MSCRFVSPLFAFHASHRAELRASAITKASIVQLTAARSHVTGDMNFREGAVSETFIAGAIVCVRCLFPLVRTIHLAQRACKCTLKRAKYVCVLRVCSQARLSRRRVAFNLNTDFDWDWCMRTCTTQVSSSSIYYKAPGTWHFFPSFLNNSAIFFSTAQAW